MVTVLLISSIVSLAALSIELRTVDIDANAPRLNMFHRNYKNKWIDYMYILCLFSSTATNLDKYFGALLEVFQRTEMYYIMECIIVCL